MDAGVPQPAIKMRWVMIRQNLFMANNRSAGVRWERLPPGPNRWWIRFLLRIEYPNIQLRANFQAKSKKSPEVIDPNFPDAEGLEPGAVGPIRAARLLDRSERKIPELEKIECSCPTLPHPQA